MGVINVYNTLNNKYDVINENGILKDILAEFQIKKAIVIKGGERLDDNYEVKPDDVLYCRIVPGETATIAIISLAVSLLAAGTAIGIGIYNKKVAEDKLEKAQRDAKNLADSVNQLPFLRGAKNKTALGNNIQYVIGETYNTPYMGTDGYYSVDGIDGKSQYWNAVLTCGYKNQLIKSLSVGNEVVKTFTETAPQSGSFRTDSTSVYHDDNNIIEVTQNGDFVNNFFRQKVKGVYLAKELKNDYAEIVDSLKEYVVQQCELYTNKIEVCVEFPSLRQYDTDSELWVEKAVTVTPEWSNDGGATWNTFYFNVTNGQVWKLADQAKKDELIAAGKLKVNGSGWYTSLSSDVKVVTDPNKSPYIWVYYDDSSSSNIIQRNSNSTVRFLAVKEFSPAECYGKTILVRLSRSMKQESNAQEDCYFSFLNCYCYDNEKSSSSKLENCNVFENASKLTLLGVRFIANENTKDILDEINVISYGSAKAITQTGLGDLTRTRNPVAWLVDILTNDLHKHSKFDVSELDINSFYTAYTFCETNKYYVDGIVTAGTKKRDLLNKILDVINGVIVYNIDGKLELLIDKAETTPVALLNTENIKSITYAKDLSRKPDGIKLTFTNRDTWQVDTRKALIDESKAVTEETIFTEKTVDLVTDKDFIYKIGQRTLRAQVLQPTTITADVGREGDYYPIFSMVLVQVNKFKQGLASSVITQTTESGGSITKLQISDLVTFQSGKRYGVIIQVVTPTGHSIIYKEVTGTGDTRTLTLSSPISGVKPVIGNHLSFGELDANGDFIKVAEKYKIYGVKKSNNGGVTLTLKLYNAALYEFGTIPEFKSNLTPTPKKGNELPTVTLSDLNGLVDNVRTITNVINYYALSTTNTQPEKSAFTTTVPTMTETNRFLWTYTKYIYKDGSSKDTNIVLSGAYGEQGAAGSGYMLDISPDSTTIFANADGTTTIESVQFGAYLFLDSVDYSSQTTFKAYIGTKEVGTWNGSILTLPTSELTKDTTQIKITAKYGTDVNKSAFAAVTKVYGNTSYQLLPSSQNIKVNSSGEINPPYVTISRQKITKNGYYIAGEDEGVIYGRVLPGGQLQKIGYNKVQPAETYDATKLYTVEFEPFMLGVATMPGSGENITIGDENNNALIFYRHK